MSGHRISKAVGYLLAALIVIFLAGQAFAAPMPWTTFSGEMASAVSGSPQLLQCPRPVNSPVEVLMVRFVYAEDGYLMVYNSETHLIAFVYYPNQGLPAEIGFGIVDMNAHDTIPPLSWRPVTERDKRPFCDLIQPEGA